MSGKFTVVKKGYDPEEVDRYIENLEVTLKAYKEKDSAIKNALINAQIAADNIVRDAGVNAVKIKRDVVDKLEQINVSIGVQKRMVRGFQEDYMQLVSKYLKQFNDADVMQLYTRINELEEYIVKLQDDTPETEDIDE